MPTFLPVIPVAQIPNGRGISRQVAGWTIAFFQRDGAVYAISAECPHRGGPLAEGYFDCDRVYCPLHGWEFDLKTGACLSNPEHSVRSFPVRIRAGQVEIQIETNAPDS
ncbi:MAG: Rieske (2Fe-2S) protein [Verrucomicrobiota bacterium]